MHHMLARPALRRRHAPGIGCSRLQQRARCRAHLPHDQIKIAHRTGAVRVLAAVRRIGLCLYDLYTLPVRLHFIRNDLRQAGANTRAHFRAMRDNLHDAIGAYADKNIQRRPGGLIQNTRERPGARHASTKHQSTSGEACELQKTAPGDFSQCVHASSSAFSTAALVYWALFIAA